jgi:hypothetical protein
MLLEHRLRQLEKEQRQLIRQNGIAFYRPHDRQDKFHIANYKHRYLRTGNRFGKSECGCAEDAAQARGERTWYKYPFDVYGRGMKVVRRHEGYPDHPYVHLGIPQRPTKGLIICADWDKAEEIFTSLELDEFGVPKGKLVRMLPQGTWDKELNGQGNVAKILVESIWGGTSTIYLDTVKSFKGNSLGQESSDWDWIHIDEPCPQDMYVANARGLIDRGGRDWFTCTPLTELWVNDMFLPREHARQLLDEPVTKDSKKGRTLFWTLTGSSFDNPYNSVEDIEDFTEGLSEDEIEARIEGKPRALTGTIYKEFDPGKHVYHELPAGWTENKDGLPRPPQDASIYLAIDTHPVNPTAVLFAAVLKTGHVLFFDEIYAKLSMKELCEIIYDKLAGLQPLRVLVEPGAWVQDPDGGCLAYDLADHSNLPIEKAPKDLQRGIFRVKQALLKTDVNGKPVLRFAWHLMETLWEFDRYVWDATRGKEGKPVDRDDHMMECLYRLVTIGLDYIEPDQHTVETRKPERALKLDLSIPTFVGRDNYQAPPARARYGDDRRMTLTERQHAATELALRSQMDGIAIV